MTSRKYYNPYQKPNNPNPMSPFFPYIPYRPPQTPQKQERETEYLELDIGSGVLWCKFCARSKCPCFREDMREKMVRLLESRISKTTGRVVVDIFNPEYRWVSGMVLLSHVGCVSFSNVDIPHNKELIQIIEDPDFLEIL
jgi:hypothetical protein